MIAAKSGMQVGITVGEVLPSPERACADTEGGLAGLEGKSDIMPCNLFLWFSEPDKGDTKHPVMQRRKEEKVRQVTHREVTDRLHSLDTVCSVLKRFFLDG